MQLLLTTCCLQHIFVGLHTHAQRALAGVLLLVVVHLASTRKKPLDACRGSQRAYELPYHVAKLSPATVRRVRHVHPKQFTQAIQFVQCIQCPPRAQCTECVQCVPCVHCICWSHCIQFKQCSFMSKVETLLTICTNCVDVHIIS